MGNYSLVVNSQFKPFSYQELMAPVLHQQQVMDNLAEQYDKLSSQADILEAMGKNDRDKEAYGRYKSYSDQLRAEADNLYTHGLNSESRRRLSDLRRQYNTEIVPIQNAWNKREKEAEMQMQAVMKNPALRFTRDASNTSINEYIDNPTGTFGVINLNNITAQMAGMAKNLAKQKRAGRKEGIDDYTYNLISPYGIDPNLINDWQNNPNASPTLTNMMNEVLKANGINSDDFASNPNGAKIIQEAIGAAQMGAWEAVGEDKEHVQNDFKARTDYQAAKEVEVAASKEAAKKDKDSGMPNWAEERAGIKTKDGYVTNAPEAIGQLKTGSDALKASIFGRYTNSVNPMAVFEDYQKELLKHQKEQRVDSYSPSSGVVWSSRQNIPDAEAAKKATLDKYRKYGVSDILTTEQYNLLKGMGYDNKSKFGNRFSGIESKLNDLVTQYTRYSTKMSGYDLPDEAIRTNVGRISDTQFKSGMMWEMKEDGSIGDPIKDRDDLNLKTNDNTKGNQVTDIQYDPQHKGKILITFSGGDKSQRVIASPDILDAQLTKALSIWESKGFDPRIITGKISEWLNTYNKQQGKSGNS